MIGILLSTQRFHNIPPTMTVNWWTSPEASGSTTTSLLVMVTIWLFVSVRHGKSPFLRTVNHLFLWAIYTMAMLNNQRVYHSKFELEVNLQTWDLPGKHSAYVWKLRTCCQSVSLPWAKKRIHGLRPQCRGTNQLVGMSKKSWDRESKTWAAGSSKWWFYPNYTH